MNRLILIGNGFDLAHKLETSYCHFITDYIKCAINNFFANNSYDDPLLTIRFAQSGYVHSQQDRAKKATNQDAWTIFKILRENRFYSVTIKSTFLDETIEKISKVNWVDLENDYFEKLINCNTGRGGYDFDRVRRLNDEFDFLKNKLEEYLINHELEKNIQLSDQLSRIFYEPIKGSDIVTVNIPDKNPKRLLFLSFNYTQTVSKYQEKVVHGIPSEAIFIHGQLGSETNPLIFGFGDEYNKSYLEFEEIRSKELLKHIKSFGYFKSSNYHNLMRFIDIDNFQVYIFGHSLGLSDRTMLKQIFEHENCKSIKLFYHDTLSDYTDKTYDISSHFSDKGLMRKKIVPFDKSFPMPQQENDTF